MLERPNLADEKILACLRACFGVAAAALEFLPVGNDSRAWAFRVADDAGRHFFLKLRQGSLYPAALLVPRLLRSQGIRQVLAPLPNRAGTLSCALEDYRLILYPFIAGECGMDVGLTPAQWTELGAALRRIHDTRLPPDIAGQVLRETFRPYWSGMVRRLDETIQAGAFDEPQQRALAAFWQERRAEILNIVARAEELGRQVIAGGAPAALCHADIHTANVLVEPSGGLHIVDWDQVILAPKERDLMFVIERSPAENEAFFRGYGPASIDRTALAYYRYEWVVQEIGDYGERIFFALDTGAVTKDDSLEGFRRLFDPHDVVELAYRSEEDLK